MERFALLLALHIHLQSHVQPFAAELTEYNNARFLALIRLNWPKLKRNLLKNGFSLWIYVEQPPGLLWYEKWQIFFFKSVELPQFFRSAKIGLRNSLNNVLSSPPDSRNGITTSVRNVKTLKSLRSGLIWFKKRSFSLESTPTISITLTRPVSRWD